MKSPPLEEGLAPDELDYFVDRYVLLQSTPAAREALYKVFPKAHEYHLNTFNRWRASDVGQERIKALRADVNEKVREKPFVQRVERIILLVETLSKVLFRLERVDLEEISPRDLATLCGEVRLNLKEIREEALPYDQDFKDQVENSLDRLVERLREKDGDLAVYALTGKKPGEKKEEVPS